MKVEKVRTDALTVGDKIWFGFQMQEILDIQPSSHDTYSLSVSYQQVELVTIHSWWLREINDNITKKDYEIATRLHANLCTYSHTDQCGWLIAQRFADPWTEDDAHKHYLNLALSLKSCGDELLQRVLTSVTNYTAPDTIKPLTQAIQELLKGLPNPWDIKFEPGGGSAYEKAVTMLKRAI